MAVCFLFYCLMEFSFLSVVFSRTVFRMTSYVYIPFDNYRATINAAHKCLLCMTKVNCLIVIIQCTKITQILPVCFDGVTSRLKVGICLCCRVTCFLRSLLLKI